MQSFRQYRTLRQAVNAQVNTGKIVNTSLEKTSVLESVTPASSIVSTESLKSSGSGEQEPIIVGWEGPNDRLNPRNWSTTRRWAIFAILWINVFAVDWASSCDSPVDKSIEKQFGVGDEVEALSPSLYTFGLALGSLFAGPISETVGRNPIYVRASHLSHADH
jgi:MFS transporter, DHA1 family, multidrug resistance protein